MEIHYYIVLLKVYVNVHNKILYKCKWFMYKYNYRFITELRISKDNETIVWY